MLGAMKASEWRKTLDPMATKAQAKILAAMLDSSLRMPLEWVGIPITDGENDAILFVSCDAFMVGEPDDFVRVNVTGETMQQACDAPGVQLPTPKMLDIIFENKEVAFEPVTYNPTNGNITVTDPATGQKAVVSMSSTTAMFASSADVTKKRAGKAGLAANWGKLWGLIRRTDTNKYGDKHPQGGVRVENYGLYTNTAPANYLSVSGNHRMWQPNSTAHNEHHTDYSQDFGPVVHPVMLVNGQLMPTADVMTSATLCKLVCHDGPLTYTHHPTLPLYTPPGGVQVIAPPVYSIRVIGQSPPVEPPVKPEVPSIPFVQAKNYTKTDVRRIDLIVIHTMEAPEKPGTAMGVAKWFAGPQAPQASAHYCIDNKQVVQCVKEGDVAWCAPGANHDGIHLEHAGYAAQNNAQWHDPYSTAMLDLSAALTASVCKRYGLPVAFVDHEGLLEGDQGITTHREVTLACIQANKTGMTTSPFYNKKRPNVPLTTHTDPGVLFPMREYLDAVKAKMGAT